MMTKNPTSPTEILFSIYGRKPPVQCLGRLKTEQALIPRGFFDDMNLVGVLRFEAEKDGSDVDAECNYGASLMNWLYGSSSINPLPPHYHCRKCKKTLVYHGGDGWDLLPMECCGKPMERDGHQIPIEVMMPRLKDSNWELSFRIAKSFSDKAVETIRTHYKRDYALVPFTTDETIPDIERFVLIPKEKTLPELDESGVWHTDLEELYQSKFRIIRLHSIEIKEQIRNYRIKTGLNPTIDDLLTEPVMAVTQAKLTAKIVEEGGRPLKIDSFSFSTLLETIGYLESDQSEVNPIFEDKEAKYSDLFTCREDVWDLLCNALKPEYGISVEFAKRVAHYTRMGAYTRNRMEQDVEQVLRDIGISDHWITQMKETCFLRGKSDLINHLLDMMRLVWFELKETPENEKGEPTCKNRFMFYKGRLRPSDSYLKAHTLTGYSEDDWYNAAYDYRQDTEVFLMERTCEKCGKNFTLLEAVEQVKGYFKPYAIDYEDHFRGDVCGDCAISEIDSIFERS